MNDLGFDIDETDFDAQSRGVGVDAARPILLACFTKLVDEALSLPHARCGSGRMVEGVPHPDAAAAGRDAP